MTELGPHAQHFVDAIRDADEPSSEDRERVRGAVLAQIALASGAVTAAAATTAQAATASAGATAAAAKSAGAGAFFAAQWKVGALVAAIGVAGTGTWLAIQSTSTDVSSTSHAEAPAAPAPAQNPEPATVARPGETDEAPVDVESLELDEPQRRGAPALRAAPAKRGPALDQEMQLLGQAQQAMKRGDSDRALRLLDQHASQHPSGVLSAERSGTRAIALCEAGKLNQGRAAARRFLAQEPKSPLASRVRAACLRPKAK